MSISEEHVDVVTGGDETGSPPANPFASFAFGGETAVPASAPASAPRPSTGAKRKKRFGIGERRNPEFEFLNLKTKKHVMLSLRHRQVYTRGMRAL